MNLQNILSAIKKCLERYYIFFPNQYISISVCSLGRYESVKAQYSQIYSILEQILRNYKFSDYLRLLYNLVCAYLRIPYK